MLSATKERRTLFIIEMARKTGVILENGELWLGVERRADPLLAEEEEFEERSEEKQDSPTDFFG